MTIFCTILYKSLSALRHKVAVDLLVSGADIYALSGSSPEGGSPRHRLLNTSSCVSFSDSHRSRRHFVPFSFTAKQTPPFFF